MANFTMALMENIDFFVFDLDLTPTLVLFLPSGYKALHDFSQSST